MAIRKFKTVFIRILGVFLVVGGIVWAGCKASEPSEAALMRTPEETVENFYRWYSGYMGNPITDRVYQSSAYLMPEAIVDIDETIATFTHGAYDPFLCAQDRPQAFVVDEAEVAGDYASVMAHGVWNPNTAAEVTNDIALELRKVGEVWKIADITCSGLASSAPNMEGPQMKTPEAAVDAFYRWYLDYAHDKGNPIVDGIYHGSEYLSEACVQKIDSIIASFDGPGHDPFLCAQDIPDIITVEDAVVEGSNATLTAHGVWNAGTESEFKNDIYLALHQVDNGGWEITDVECKAISPIDAPSVPSAEYQPVEIPEVGLTFEVPVGWQRLGSEWTWGPETLSDPHVGVNWVALEPPLEPEAALLPQPAQILESEPVELAWSNGRRFTLEVYAQAPQESETKAPVLAVETHVLLTVGEGDARRAVDFYASAPTETQLATLEPTLQHMLASVTAPLAEEQDTAAPTPVASVVEGWQTFEDEVYGFSFQYPQDWTFDVQSTTGPGVPEDFPIERLVIFFPESMTEALKHSGPPDPSQPLAVAPLQLEVCVGDEAQFRRVYAEPTRREVVARHGVSMVIEEEEISETVTLFHYVFQDPQAPDVRVVFNDMVSGFPDRAAGQEDVIKVLKQIIYTFTFVRA
jgi:hypothetical protein